MGLIGLLIAAVLIILFFIFSSFSNSPSVITPKDYKNLQNEAQEVMDSTTEKSKLEQDQIKNIDSR